MGDMVSEQENVGMFLESLKEGSQALRCMSVIPAKHCGPQVINPGLSQMALDSSWSFQSTQGSLPP